MIDRSYLPFQSARNYVDRGMAKWMGFFISEHSTSLAKEDDAIDFSGQMTSEELNLLLSQAYINKLEVLLYTSLQKKTFKGKIYEIHEGQIYFSSYGQMLIFTLESILKLELMVQFKK